MYDQLVERLVELTRKLAIGDPTERSNYLGPVINRSSYRDFQNYAESLDQNGRILTGGKVLTEGAYANGYFCEPTLVGRLAPGSPPVAAGNVCADHDHRPGKKPG